MQSKAKTVKAYLKELPAERRAALEAVRATILKNLPKGYEEGMQCGMIGYYVPHSLYPGGYHCDPNQPLPFASLASQKNHMAIYLMHIYGNSEEESRFREAWADTGKKLDMGKSCIRFKKLEDVPLKVIGQTIKRATVRKLIAHYESAIHGASAKKSRSRKKTATATKSAPAKAGTTKTASKPAKKKSVRKKSSRKRR